MYKTTPFLLFQSSGRTFHRIFHGRGKKKKRKMRRISFAWMKPYRLIRWANLWRFKIWLHLRGPKITGYGKPWKMRGICNNAVWIKLPHWTLIETDEVKTFTVSPKWNICNLVESSQRLSTSNLNVMKY